MSVSGQIDRSEIFILKMEKVARIGEFNYEFEKTMEIPEWYEENLFQYVVYANTKIEIQSEILVESKENILKALIIIPNVILTDSVAIEFIQTKDPLNPMKIESSGAVQLETGSFTCSSPMSTTVKLDWVGGHCQLCDPGNRNYSCNVNPGYFTDWNGGNKTFTDPVPSGHVIMMVEVETFGALRCSNGNFTAGINGTTIGTAPNVGSCSCNSCGTNSVQGNFSAGLSGYNYGGNNTLNISSTGTICVDYAIVTLYYCGACSLDCASFPYSP